MSHGEGAFLACSFWLADAYQSIGRHDDAVRLFEHLLAIRNDLGLLAEEYDHDKGRQLGNFPQAFSHVGLINTAFNLTRTTHPTEQRARVNGSEVHATERPKSPKRPGPGPDEGGDRSDAVKRRGPSAKAR